jgi:hypothetical protein
MHISAMHGDPRGAARQGADRTDHDCVKEPMAEGWCGLSSLPIIIVGNACVGLVAPARERNDRDGRPAGFSPMRAAAYRPIESCLD